MTKAFLELFKRIQKLHNKAVSKGVTSSVSFQIASDKKGLVSYYINIGKDEYKTLQASDNKYLNLDIQEFERFEKLAIEYLNKL